MSAETTPSGAPNGENYRLNIPPEMQVIWTLGVVGCNLELVLYGLVVALFIQCFKSATRNSGKWDATQRRSKIVQLVYICSVFIVSSLFIAVDTWTNVYSTLEFPLYPGGPLGWMMEYSDPVMVLGSVSFLFISWLSDGFMMYRLYIVYTQSRVRLWIMALPGLLYIASIATGILVLSQVSLPHSTLFGQINFGTANFSIMAALHILLTSLISARLMLHRIRMQKLMDFEVHSLRMYTSVSTILIESSALYSAFALMFIIPFALDHPTSRFFLPLLAQVQVISPLLVAYRLARETAWTTKTSQTLTNAPSTIVFDSKEKASSGNTGSRTQEEISVDVEETKFGSSVSKLGSQSNCQGLGSV